LTGKALLPLLAALSLASCQAAPQIESISPRIGLPGDTLTIKGRHFGRSQDESFVTIAGVFPTTPSYIEWTDTEIRVKLPDFGDSGLVYVHVRGKRSKPALFASKNSIPQPIVQPETSNMPAQTPVVGEVPPDIN
jgi:hypothetical protein